ncbi:hypothetical protein MUN88_17135 [Gracilibacillus caseinilyticus]|uniref:Uncharacterized protein n=1 Tax=Gracilibacillus caseinilyticus TaxID=2932256 RepID=A0ABY4EV83_9BACI|nr:hypothetical protein [Gracilibacillus caseinilyticus]UOQ47757.1 hypothetical protein MUN88_17135 [Gracilibacillus caseinilyticus]
MKRINEVVIFDGSLIDIQRINETFNGFATLLNNDDLMFFFMVAHIGENKDNPVNQPQYFRTLKKYFPNIKDEIKLKPNDINFIDDDRAQVFVRSTDGKDTLIRFELILHGIIVVIICEGGFYNGRK